MKDEFKPISHRVAQMVILSLVIAIVLYGIIYYVGTDVLKTYFTESRYISEREKPYVVKLQKFVDENDISTTDTEKLNDWLADNDVFHFEISKEGKLIYSVSYIDGFIQSAKEMYDFRYSWIYYQPVQFKDMEADVFIYANYVENFYVYFAISDAVLSIIISLIIIFGRINHIINNLKKALQEAEVAEKEARRETDRLMRSMAHDLRTPLTGLMSYTDILKMENQMGVVKSEHIDIVSAKASEIKELTDQLFDFSIASSEEELEMDESTVVEFAIGDYMAEMYSILGNNDFFVDISKIKWQTVKIAVNNSLLGRIFNNLTSNICKYADKEYPITIRTMYKNEICGIEIMNNISLQKKLLDSADIGLKNVDMMMKRMGGKMEYTDDGNIFRLVLWFRIVNN